MPCAARPGSVRQCRQLQLLFDSDLAEERSGFGARRQLAACVQSQGDTYEVCNVSQGLFCQLAVGVVAGVLPETDTSGTTWVR